MRNLLLALVPLLAIISVADAGCSSWSDWGGCTQVGQDECVTRRSRTCGAAAQVEQISCLCDENDVIVDDGSGGIGPCATTEWSEWSKCKTSSNSLCLRHRDRASDCNDDAVLKETSECSIWDCFTCDVGKTDTVFVIDAASTVSEAVFRRELKFVYELITKLPLNQGAK